MPKSLYLVEYTKLLVCADELHTTVLAEECTLRPNEVEESPRVGQNAAMIGYEGAESGYTYKSLTPIIGRRLDDVNLLCVNMNRGVSKVVISSRKYV